MNHDEPHRLAMGHPSGREMGAAMPHFGQKTIAGLIAGITITPSRILVAASATACVAGLVDYGLLYTLAHLNVPRLAIRIQNAALTGTVSGACVWALLFAMASRRQYFRNKIQVVADLNHELRNALEVILNSRFLQADQRYTALLESADRINKALAELLAEIHSTDGGRTFSVMMQTGEGATVERITQTLDFALARAKHLEWKIRLRDFLDGKAGLTEAQATSHQDCDLGKWLYSDGLKKYGEVSAMHQLEQVHAELHGIVKRVLQMQKAGDTAGAQQELKKIDPVSTQIVNLLKDIEKQLRA